MIRRLLVLAGIVSVFAPSLACASTKEDVCVKYEEEYGWSKGYAVQATIISGSDLNSAVGSFNRFKSFSTYAVVFWDKNQASIFELPPLSMGNAPMIETKVEDQEGRAWKIKEGHLFCQ